MINTDVKSVGIMISNSCQLNCKYCYIKNKINSFLDDNYINEFNIFMRNRFGFIDKIIENFPNVNRFEFWGAEPLMFYDEMHETMKYILEKTDKDEIIFMVSSNLAFDEDTINDFIGSMYSLLKIAEEKQIEVIYLLQCSIDFPANRHNQTRKFITQKGSYQTVRNAYENILNHLLIGNLDSEYFNLYLTTNSVTNIDDLVPIDITISQISDILTKDLRIFKEIASNFSNFQFNLSYFPNIANGIKLDDAQGKKIYYFYKYLFKNIENNSSDITLDVLPYYFTRDFSLYVLDYFGNKSNSINTCGCFNSYIQVDIDGNILPCHEFLHLLQMEKNDVILGNIFDKNVISNTNLIDMITDYKAKLYNSIDMFDKAVFEKYKSKFEKLNSRKEYIEEVKNRMFRFYIGKECLANNYMSNKNLTMFNFNDVINSYLPETIILMEKFIMKHEKALKMSYLQR